VNNSKDVQHLKLLSIFHYVHVRLNTALLLKVIGFRIFFGVGFFGSFISTFLGAIQSSSISSASIISQPKTVPHRLIVPQNDRSSLLSQVIEPLTTEGRGSLSVINGTSSDAYIKLVDPLSNESVASFYVKSSSSFTLEGVADGSYQVIFASGEDWDSNTQSFTMNKSFTKFDSTLDFTTRQYTDEIRYSTHEITLHQVLDGNATTSEVNEQEFAQY
jgi:hypothetical protein